MDLTQADRYALARAFQGMEAVEVGPLSPLASLMVKALEGKKPGADDLAVARQWFGQDLINQIFSVDPTQPPPVVTGKIENVPKLPKGAQISADDALLAEDVCGWLSAYMDHVSSRASMTDRMMLEAGGLWLISLMTARRAVLHLDFARIYNSLYVWWVAGTTYWRKSTGLRAIEDIGRAVAPHMFLASQSTSEMLIWRLAGNVPVNYEELDPESKLQERNGQLFSGQRGFISDEASKLFQKDYMKGLPEVLMQMYDNPALVEQEFKGQGKIIVRNPGLSLLFATTPARMARVFDDTEWDDGLLARFALLTPGSQIVKRPPTVRAREGDAIPTAVLFGLRALYDKLPAPQVEDEDAKVPLVSCEPVRVAISDAALDMFNAYADALHELTHPDRGLDERLRGPYGRLPTMGLKVAMSLALMDWAQKEAEDDGGPWIERQHWARAQQIVEQWRESAHRLLSEVNRSIDHRTEDRIMEFMRKPHRVAPSAMDIYRGAGIPDRRMAYQAIDALTADCKLVQVLVGNRKGYRLASEVQA